MITKLIIKDFKSIRDLTVELDPVTVFVGRSGTGKSNIVQSLRFLRNYLLNQAEAVAIEGGWQRIVPAGEKKPRTSIEVYFRLKSGQEEFRYRLAFAIRGTFTAGHQLEVDEEFLALGSQTIFHRKLVENKGWVWVVSPAAVETPNPSSSLAIQQMPFLRPVLFANTALSKGVGYYNFPTSVFGVLARAATQNELNLNRSLDGLKEDTSNYLEVVQQIVEDWAHPETFQNIVAALKHLNPSIVSIAPNSRSGGKGMTTSHAVNSGVLEIGFDQESDGFRRFFAHVLALYQVQPKLVNIFEEPENGIYPGALALLAEEFLSAAESERGQVILTTHSPALLDEIDVDRLRVVELKDGNTVVGRVASSQRESVKEGLLRTGELLTVDEPRIQDRDAPAEKAGA